MKRWTRSQSCQGNLLNAGYETYLIRGVDTELLLLKLLSGFEGQTPSCMVPHHFCVAIDQTVGKESVLPVAESFSVFGVIYQHGWVSDNFAC